MPTALLLSIFTIVSTSALESTPSVVQGVELKRGAFFGARVDTVTDEVRDRLKLDEGVGVQLGEIIPASTAEAAGFAAGDVLVTLDEKKLVSSGEFMQLIGGRKAGAEVTIQLRRGDELLKKKVPLKGRPLEMSDLYEVVYDSVPSNGARLRTILTRPRSAGKHVALFVIQGIGVFSVDNPVGPISPFRKIIEDFTRHGFVTLRVDKPGCGDSEGGPARDVDFDTELDGYRQALKQLKARGDVDADRVFLFGHSMGGVMAPLLAAEIPVKGIIAYGTITRTWTEYWLENIRRQMELADADPSAIDRDIRAEAALATYLFANKLSPKEIVTRYPHLRERIEQTITEDRYFVDRSLTFFRQLADKYLGAAWESFGGHALAICGKSDFLSNEDDHALIARIVNRDHPGHGTFLALDGIDHGFHRAASKRESFQRSRSREPGDFNPAILDVCREWISRTDVPTADQAKPAG